MKVKFRVHSIDRLRLGAVDESEISRVPLFFFQNCDKEYVGDLEGNDIVVTSKSGKKSSFDAKCCESIRPYILHKWRVIFAVGEGRHLHTDSVIVTAETTDRAIEVVKNELPKSKYHKVEEVK